MADRLAADAVVALHLAFVAFAALGGVLAWRRLAWAWAHLPALAWAAFVELSGSICPLTPLENRLRRQAGDAGYAGGFVEHYLIPVLYPAGLTPGSMRWIGAALIAVNVAIYAVAVLRARSREEER